MTMMGTIGSNSCSEEVEISMTNEHRYKDLSRLKRQSYFSIISGAWTGKLVIAHGDQRHTIQGCDVLVAGGGSVLVPKSLVIANLNSPSKLHAGGGQLLGAGRLYKLW